MRRILTSCRQRVVRAVSKPSHSRGFEHNTYASFLTNTFPKSQNRCYSSSSGSKSDDGKPEQEYWPDGTPKKFSGKEAWKNWINFDSEFRELTDELNRARHFFFEVDAKGRLHRLELDQPGQRFGHIRDGKDTLTRLMLW